MELGHDRAHVGAAQALALGVFLTSCLRYEGEWRGHYFYVYRRSTSQETDDTDAGFGFGKVYCG